MITKSNPSLVIHAESGNETPLGSGNFNVSVSCELRMTGETEDLATYRSLSRDVLGQLMASDLAESLSTEATDFHVFGILNREFRSGVDESQWLSVLTFTAYCCRTDCT